MSAWISDVCSSDRERGPDIPRIALTATADAPSRREIAERLALEDARQFVSSFDRPNIRYRVVQKDGSGQRALLDFIKDHRGDSGIVYAFSRKRVDKTAEQLQAAGIDALPRSEEHTSELQSLMRISYAVLCLKKKNNKPKKNTSHLPYTTHNTIK